MKACSYRAEEIRDAAVKCRYCGSDFATPTVPSSASGPSGSVWGRAEARNALVFLVVGVVAGVLVSQYAPILGGVATLGRPWSPARQQLIGAHVAAFAAVGTVAGYLLGRAGWQVPRRKPSPKDVSPAVGIAIGAVTVSGILLILAALGVVSWYLRG